MITVMEVWYLKPGLEPRTLDILREMENLLGPAAHAHPGWLDHARFLQDEDDPPRLVVLYSWRSRELLADLLASEEQMLERFVERYFTRPRQIFCLNDVPVDVDVELGPPGQTPGE
jgi:3-oxoacyl-[acyl-carrier protein] reductase